jgi:hypothetical protein
MSSKETHTVRGWRIHDCRGNHIGNVSVILVFWELVLWVGEELSDSRQVDIAAQDRDANRGLSSKLLELFDELLQVRLHVPTIP